MKKAIFRLKRESLVLLCVLIFTSLSYGQNDYGQILAEEASIRNRSELMDRMGKRRTPPSTGIKKFYRTLKAEERKRLQPANKLLIQYKDFLKSPHAGIVKILPDPKCDIKLVNASDLNCANVLPIVGMGSWYSFNARSHTALYKSDLSYRDNNLSVVFTPLLLGMIVDLGDSEIDAVSMQSPEIIFLSNLKLATPYSEVAKQREQTAKGLDYKGRLYAAQVPTKLNHTYALRSINYFRVRTERDINLYDDMTIVCRIIDIDSEGSITLIWKTLIKNSKVKVFK